MKNKIDLVALSGAIGVVSLILTTAGGIIAPMATKQQMEQMVAAEVRRQNAAKHHK